MTENIELDPRLKLFHFDLNCCVNWEEITGKKVTEFDDKSNKDMRTFLWCGIKDNLPEAEQAKFTLAAAGRLIDSTNRVAATAFIMKVISEGSAKN